MEVTISHVADDGTFHIQLEGPGTNRLSALTEQFKRELEQVCRMIAVYNVLNFCLNHVEFLPTDLLGNYRSFVLDPNFIYSRRHRTKMPVQFTTHFITKHKTPTETHSTDERSC